MAVGFGKDQTAGISAFQEGCASGNGLLDAPREKTRLRRFFSGIGEHAHTQCGSGRPTAKAQLSAVVRDHAHHFAGGNLDALLSGLGNGRVVDPRMAAQQTFFFVFL